MAIDWSEWLNLALRWLHLVTGIAWIGSSFYFVWLDNHLKKPTAGEASGELWSVHGGGFYHNQKYQVAPTAMPDELHWFKWEAYFTWISGFSLLVLIYYVGAQSFLVDPAKAALSPALGIGIGLASLALGWLVYDALCRSPVGSNNLALGLVWFVCLLFAASLLDSLFNSRAAYLHVGAIVGSVMVANVFFIIIPNQKKVVADLVAGRTPDPALGAAAKQRSLHNNYMTLPVLFIMISNHYPMTYGAQRPWLVLALLGLTGVAIRHVFNLRGRGRPTPAAIAVAAVLALASVTYVTWEKSALTPATGPAGTFAEIQPVLATHCASCHNVPNPPRGVALDSYEHVRAASARIKAMAVDTQVMPLGNPTHMTPAERQRLGAWIAAGTPR
ncbi:MAG: urate hydroxylase PuuD [Alphaproteobacteria bacterium]|nr:MAG: urate hydroxylase PuuD [Alphaproteobacteria bacterium]